MTWIIFWKFVKPFLPFLLLALAITTVIWTFRHQAGKIEDLELQIARAETEEARLNLVVNHQHNLIEFCNANTAELETLAQLYQEQLAEALARPPEVVVRYRDRIQTVTEAVASEDCPTAVAEAVGLLQESLQEASDGGP